jgi:16S rRNA (uracil1498-N3)-methyltransferase
MRFFVPGPLLADTVLALPAGAARHAQVRRVQPGDSISLFDGTGCDWPAQVLRVGRSTVEVRLGAPQTVDRELPTRVTLALGMPANERMDSLVEKASELGVAAIQPLLCERSVLRLHGERAERKREHWRAIAESACEQSGRARVPAVAPVASLAAWLQALPAEPPSTRLVLSLRAQATPLAELPPGPAGRAWLALSGPEGGLSPAEEAAACSAGFQPCHLGPRVLRADTAPLALLAWLGLQQSRGQKG